MHRFLLPFFLVFISGNLIFAQIYFEPLTGYQVDANNGFNQLVAGGQLSMVTGDSHELLFVYRKSWSANQPGVDSSFTANPALPVYAPAPKNIRARSGTFAVGHRFFVTKANKRDAVSILFFTGITHQVIDVKYQYDKLNYSILNPDQTVGKTGLFLGLGAEYMRKLKVGRIFGQLFISTPPSLKSIPDPSRFQWVVPVNINVGYSIQLKAKKEKNAKAK